MTEYRTRCIGVLRAVKPTKFRERTTSVQKKKRSIRMTENINTNYAEKLYQEEGEVGFWYFYKDGVTSHFKTLFEQSPTGKGPKLLVEGIAHTTIGILSLFLIATSPIWVPVRHLKKSHLASKDYQEWIEKSVDVDNKTNEGDSQS